MSLYLVDLDQEIRQLMLEEMRDDIRLHRFHISAHLSGQGLFDYPGLLEEAVRQGDAEWLAERLRERRRLLRSTQRRKPSGGFVIAHSPFNAAQVLAESEFNRYYIRAVCRRAIALGVPVLVYRAKTVGQPRPGSQDLVGRALDPAALLADLREHTGQRTQLGVPGGPGSGISVRLPPPADPQI